MKRNKHRKFVKGVLPMFQDEATFGRITDPASCWSPPKERPEVEQQRIRKYKTVYGAVCPVNGFCLFLVLDKSNSDEMSKFLRQLSEQFPDYLILLCMDNASWHTAGKEKLTIPVNIKFFFIPPRTPQMNPIEIVWRDIRKRGFKNKMFSSIAAVVDKFIETVDCMTKNDIISLTLWDWVADCFDV